MSGAPELAVNGRPPPALLGNGVLVVGSGLLGTSIGLALRRAGIQVRLRDRDPRALAEAERLGAGRADDPVRDPARDLARDRARTPASIAVVAVPPAATGAVVTAVLAEGAAEYATDVASVKAMPVSQVAAAAAEPGRYVGGHPMAGREVSGPQNALVDLFEGRPWVLCPDSGTDPHAVTRALAVVRAVGATPVTMPAAEHDAAVALVSHAPHVVAALMAGRMLDAPDHEVRLAGQGVSDVTRVAAGDPALWTEILTSNSAAVAQVLRRLRGDLDRVLEALESEGGPALGELLAAGADGRARLPGKHGEPHVEYATVAVVVDDRPGQLAALFADAGAAGVNIEDVRIEHSPGQPMGTVELDVRPEAGGELAAGLRKRGWTVHE